MPISIGEYKQAVEALAQRMKAFYDKASVEIEKEWKKNYIPGSKFANEVKALAEETQQEIDPKFIERFVHKTVMTLMLKFIFYRFAEDKKLVQPFFRNEAVVKWKAKKEARSVILEAFEKSGNKFKGLYKPTVYDELWPKEETIFTYLIDALADEPSSSIYKNKGALNFATLDPRVVSAFYEKLFDRKKRKELGLFFTPPVIADYLVEKAFEGQNITKDFLVLEPACGSGQILLAAYRRLKAIFLEKKLFENEHEAHKHILTHNLWGVDIEPFAVLLSRINLTLQDLEHAPEYINVIHGDSLMEISYDAPQAILLDGADSKKQQLTKDKFVTQGGKEIIYWHNGSGKVYFEKPVEQEVLLELAERMKTGIFESSEIRTMKEMPKQFSAVVANPPYISFGLRGVGKLSKDQMKNLRERYPDSAEYKLSYYALFIELGIRKLNKKAKLSYITPDSFLLGRYFSKIRKFILSTCKIKEILLFKEDFWESGVVGSPVISTFTEDDNGSHRNNNMVIKLCDSLDDFDKKRFIVNTYSQGYYYSLPYNRFRLFFYKNVETLIKRIDSIGERLGNFVIGRTGVRSLTSQEDIQAKRKIGQMWKPGLTSGAQVNRYSLKWGGDYLNIDSKKLNKGGWDPNIILNDKILMRQTADMLVATIDNHGFYHLNNLHSFAPKNKRADLKYLLSIINSTLLNFYYQSISLEVGRVMAQTDIETIEELPIYPATPDQQKPFIEIVDVILSLNKKLQETEKSFQEFVDEKIKTKIKLRAIEESDFTNIKDSRAKLGEKGKINVQQGGGAVTIFINNKPVIKIMRLDETSIKFLAQYLNGLRTDILSAKDGDSWIERILNTEIPWDKKSILEKLLKEYKNLQSSTEQLKKEIGETDGKIDGMVYELYGITDEEQEIIKSKIQ